MFKSLSPAHIVLFSGIITFVSTLHAASEASLTCDKETGADKTKREVLAFLEPLTPKQSEAVATDPNGCEDPGEHQKAMKDFDAFVAAAKARGEKVIVAKKTPSKRTSNSATFYFPDQKLAPGEIAYLAIPSDLAKHGTDYVVLGHRQNPATQTGTTNGDKYDSVPGLTAVQLFDPSRPPQEQLRYWKGMSSGEKGAKFAEPDYSYEIENLYQWSKLGHVGVKSGKTAHDDLKATLVKLESVGKDTVELKELTVKTRVSKPDSSVTQVFTPGSAFGDPTTGENYKVGGGQSAQGTFPNAVVLGGWGNESNPKLPPGWQYQDGELSIPLPAGKKLMSVEMSAGDSHPDKINNEDGGWGTKGWAKLSVETRNGNQKIDTLMERENVPPEGFLTGSPTKCGRTIGGGERLVIRSHADRTYLGAIRLNFAD